MADTYYLYAAEYFSDAPEGFMGVTEDRSLFESTVLVYHPGANLVTEEWRQVNGRTLSDAVAAASGETVSPDAWGGWVGPAPRVTRVAAYGVLPFVAGNPGGGALRITRVAWVWRFPEALVTAHGAEWCAAAVRAALQIRLNADKFHWEGNIQFPVGGHREWSSVLKEPYHEALHGALAWWNGAASSTNTRNDFPWPWEGYENPTGPTTTATRPGTLTEHATQALRDLGEGFKFPFATLGKLLMVGGALATGWGIYKSTRRVK